MNIGTLIKQERERRGVGVRELQRMCGISNLSRIENGEISPRYKTIVRIAEGLGIEVSELVATQEQASTPIEQTEEVTRG